MTNDWMIRTRCSASSSTSEVTDCADAYLAGLDQQSDVFVARQQFQCGGFARSGEDACDRFLIRGGRRPDQPWVRIRK
jgi:hypothetical protein